MNRWFNVPRVVETDPLTGGDNVFPKYSDRVGAWSSFQISQGQRFIVWYSADESTLDEIADESDADELSIDGVLQFLNQKGGFDYDRYELEWAFGQR